MTTNSLQHTIVAADMVFAAVTGQPAALPRRPNGGPRLLARWLDAEYTRRGSSWLLVEAKNIAAELARLQGYGVEPQEGARMIRSTLHDSRVLVEYEHQPAEPDADDSPGCDEEVNLLGVYVNGRFADPEFFEESVRERWLAEAAEDVRKDREHGSCA
jgi:hypothetical protein